MQHDSNTIFIQIASYRDPELIPTIKNMLENAKHPENLHIGICWQHGDDQPIDIFLDEGFDIQSYSEVKGFNVINATWKEAKFSIIDVDYFSSQGACWARNFIQQLYQQEKYTLQLDSHHRFIPDWDITLIDMLEGLRSESEKPLLTAYVPSFDPENDPAGRVNEAWGMNFDRFIPEGAVFFIPSTIEGWREMTKPIRARFYSAHFCFTDGIFAEEVQHDDLYFFHSEESSISARAFTHGYDLYHPHIPVVWHEYTRKNRSKIWTDHGTPEKKKGRIKLDWVERNNNCHKRNRILFGMDGEDPKQIDFGKYGFGTKRTLREYEEYAGISFEFRGVQQCTLDKELPIWPLVKEYQTEQEWKDSFTGSHDFRVCVHKGEIEVADDYDFCFVGCHDENGNEINRKDLQAHELKQYLEGDWIDYRYIFLHDNKPVTYTLWPHSKSKGWLNKIVKTIDKV